MPRLSAREVDSVRQLVSPSLSGASSEHLEQLVAETLSSLPPDTAEDFLKTLGSVAKAALPVIQKAAPMVLKGVAQGAGVGGPFGALIGTGANLASGLINQSKGPPSTVAPGAPPTSSPKGAAGVSSADVPPNRPGELPTGQVAAAIVLGLMQNTMIQQALLSQVLGENGRPMVQTPSGAALPRAAINQLLAHLLSNAADRLPESDSINDQSYLMDESGEYLIDPASPEQQAAMVLVHLNAGRTVDEFNSDGSGDAAEYWDELEWLPEGVGEDDSLNETVGATVEFY